MRQQFTPGRVYKLQLIQRRSRGGVKSDGEVISGNLHVHNVFIQADGSIAITGEILENGEKYTLVLGKGKSR